MLQNGVLSGLVLTCVGRTPLTPPDIPGPRTTTVCWPRAYLCGQNTPDTAGYSRAQDTYREQARCCNPRQNLFSPLSPLIAIIGLGSHFPVLRATSLLQLSYLLRV